jgi:hypothetical protein
MSTTSVIVLAVVVAAAIVVVAALAARELRRRRIRQRFGPEYQRLRNPPHPDPPPAGRRESVWREGLLWLAGISVLFGLWELFVDTYTWPEILCGLGAAVLSGTAVTLARVESRERFAIRPAWLRPAADLPARPLVDTWRVFRELGGSWLRRRPLRGRVRAVRFEPGGDDPLSSGRRALQDYYTTFTCNTMSFGIDREGRWILVHELAPVGADPTRPSLPVKL